MAIRTPPSRQKAKNLKGKLMIAHNLEDDNVLFQNSAQMIDALQRAGKLVEMQFYNQKTHAVTGAEARQLNATMVEFFERTTSHTPRQTRAGWKTRQAGEGAGVPLKLALVLDRGDRKCPHRS